MPKVVKDLRKSSNKKKAAAFGASNSENDPAPISSFGNQTSTENNAAASQLSVKGQNSATKKKTLFGDATAATNNFADNGMDKMF